MSTNEHTAERLGNDLVWGAQQIATEIGRPRRATYHLLERGHIPARKVGDTWVASRSALRRHFAGDKTEAA